MQPSHLLRSMVVLILKTILVWNTLYLYYILPLTPHNRGRSQSRYPILNRTILANSWDILQVRLFPILLSILLPNSFPLIWLALEAHLLLYLTQKPPRTQMSLIWTSRNLSREWKLFSDGNVWFSERSAWERFDRTSNAVYLATYKLTVITSTVADDDLPNTISTSYGDDEQTVPLDYATEVCNNFATIGARGVSILFSSGDDGYAPFPLWIGYVLTIPFV